MIRKRPSQLNIRHDRWLVSYADFITLLFAFFVVMYSISQVNEGKYRILADDLLDAFGVPELDDDPIQVGEVSRGAVIESIKDSHQKQGSMEGDFSEKTVLDYAAMGRQVSEHLLPLIENGFRVEANEAWLEIELDANGLFEAGRAIPSENAVLVFEELSQYLKQHQNYIQVAGFTDSQPVQSNEYPSNWELSSARAASVVRLLAQGGVNPKQLAAMGYAHYNPIASNKTAAGRAKNRRMVIRIEAASDDRPFLPKTAELMEDITTVVPGASVIDGKLPQERGGNLGVIEQDNDLQNEKIYTDAQLHTLIVDDAPAEQVNKADDSLEVEADNLIKRVELEGGGVLYTSDPEPHQERGRQ
ncbi:MAG: flagellar motor protein MotD [Cellvibrionaceae bacterium]